MCRRTCTRRDAAEDVLERVQGELINALLLLLRHLDLGGWSFRTGHRRSRLFSFGFMRHNRARALYLNGGEFNSYPVRVAQKELLELQAKIASVAAEQ